MRNLIRAGIQLPFFSIPEVGDEGIFEHTAAIATSADSEGFDAIFVMDHFFQLPFLGGPTEPMLEGYSLLSALAARTRSARLGTLVTGVTYRNPAYLAKTITTLDVISGGRAIAGLGAAWYEEEHTAFGYDYPATAERFELLENTIDICEAMFSGEPTVSGPRASIDNAHNVPAPLSPGGPPILIGGAGEKRTLPLVARRGAASNFNCTIPEAPAKLEILKACLTDAGRDRDSINVTLLCSVITADSDKEAERKFRDMAAGRGMDPVILDNPEVRGSMLERMMVGGIDKVAEQLADLCGPNGLDGIVAMLPADAADPDGPAVLARAFRAAGLLD
jgi:F420-dependent oxidoreductase-like protein